MLATFFQLTLLVLLPFATATDLQFKSRSDGPTIFNPPKPRPILHLVPIIDFPTNATDVFTVTARIQNLGGNFTGVINGDILPIGAAVEVLAPESDGVKTFYTNTFSLNTTEGIVISMLATGTIHYANNALHGFGSVTFESGAEEYRDLVYGGYVAEFAAVFGEYAFVDVWALETAGRKDGGRVLALEPPGGGPA